MPWPLGACWAGFLDGASDESFCDVKKGVLLRGGGGSCFRGSSLHSGHVGSAAGSRRWAYALRGGVRPARRRARKTASALLEVVMQSAFQERVTWEVAMESGRY